MEGEKAVITFESLISKQSVIMNQTNVLRGLKESIKMAEHRGAWVALLVKPLLLATVMIPESWD